MGLQCMQHPPFSLKVKQMITIKDFIKTKKKELLISVFDCMFASLPIFVFSPFSQMLTDEKRSKLNSYLSRRIS